MEGAALHGLERALWRRQLVLAVLAAITFCFTVAAVSYFRVEAERAADMTRLGLRASGLTAPTVLLAVAICAHVVLLGYLVVHATNAARFTFGRHKEPD